MVTRNQARSNGSKVHNDQDEELDIDKLAGDIFAALDDANSEEDELSEDSEDNDDQDNNPSSQINERKLIWRPSLRLPGSRIDDKISSSPQQQRTTIANLIDDKKGSTSKLLHVPPPDQRNIDRAARKGAPDTAGKNWFHLPATEITEETKTDLRVLRLRSAFDPKTFYKKFDNTKFPKHFQMGTVVEGASEFYASRMTKKERKRTLADEIMADSHLTEVRKKRYTKMQEEKAYWSKRPKGRKTENARLKKKPHRPKH